MKATRKSKQERKTANYNLLHQYLRVIVPPFLILGTFLIVFISKGYRIDISNREIEKTGVLTFTTIPRRATVHVDDEYIGRSPKAVPGLDEGIHSVKVTKDGYMDWLMDVTVQVEQSIPIEPVLFLKEPRTEILFPDTDNNNLLIDQLFFDPDGQMAVFTTFISPDEGNTELKTMQIWAYTVNKRFWEFEPKPRKIAEFTETTEDPLSIQPYDITLSKNAQKILFSTGQEDSLRYFLLKTDTDNTNPAEIEELKKYKNITPAWSNDSQHLIFSINGELRSINVDSRVQTILDEKKDDEAFIWTSDKDGMVYSIKEKDQIYTISRVHCNGENKTDIVENLRKSPERMLFEDNEMETIPVTDNEPSTLPEDLIHIDTINEIRITDDRKSLMLFTDTQILLYTIDKDEIHRIPVKSPRYIAETEKNRKFIFLSNNEKLIEYTSKVDEGDPMHQVGSKTLITLDPELSYTGFKWYPEYTNVIYGTTITKDSGDTDNTINDDSTDNDTDNPSQTVHIINTDSLQVFDVFNDAANPKFALGNSGKYIVTLCGNANLCKVTIH